MYARIDKVVVISGTRRQWSIFETASAQRLMREFERCGEEGVHIRGVLCELGLLHPRSLSALNCLLRHGPGLRLFGKHHGRTFRHRFGWYALQDYLAMRWVR